MPTYEYECRSCGFDFETVQNMNDEPIKICPKCGKSVRRLIFGGSGVIFKGSGFYVNDSKSTNPCQHQISHNNDQHSSDCNCCSNSKSNEKNTSKQNSTVETKN